MKYVFEVIHTAGSEHQAVHGLSPLSANEIDMKDIADEVPVFVIQKQSRKENCQSRHSLDSCKITIL